jgi:hypothetical protein
MSSAQYGGAPRIQSMSARRKHEPGTVVAEPVSPRGCWGVVSTWHGAGKLKNPVSCSHFARPGKCTCVAHRRLDGAACELRDRLASEAAG